MKRFLTIIVILLATLSVHAVLKEKDLAQTLQILRAELNTQHNELSERSELDNKRSEQMRNRLIATMKRSDQNSLMLYSQKQEYVFDLTYACHEATEQYQEFQRQRIPFKQFMSKTEGEIARYDSLIGTLNSMPQRVLSPPGTERPYRLSGIGIRDTRETREEPRQDERLHRDVRPHGETPVANERLCPETL